MVYNYSSIPFSDVLAKLPLNLRHGWVILSCVSNWCHYLSRSQLTHWGLVMPYCFSEVGLHIASVKLVYIGSGNGLLPGSTKPLPDPILTCHYLGTVVFIWWQYSIEILNVSFFKRCLKIANLKSLPHLSENNELASVGTKMPLLYGIQYCWDLWSY